MIKKLHKKIESEEISFEEITKKYLSKIKEKEPDISAFITTCEDSAIGQAKKLDENRKNGNKQGILAGIPVAIKDNICTENIRTTCASRMLENFVPPYNATVVQKLLSEGAIIIGKTNLDEFAMGSSTETSFFNTTKNPHNNSYVPGGSSGGSAACIAAGEAVISLGSDTGGSIRQPASHCGVVGIKPTYGRVSRYGLVAFASSLDQIGPIASNVEDTAITLQVIAGHDKKDSTSAQIPVPNYLENIKNGVKGKKIGIPKEYFTEGLNPFIKETIYKKIDMFKQNGAEIVEVSLPHLDYAVATYYIICTAEASSNLARYDGVKYGYRSQSTEDLIEMYSKTRDEGFGEEVKRRIMLGTYVLSSGYYDAYYRKASKVRTLIKSDYKKAWEKCDLIISPVAPTPAFKIGEMIDDPLQMYLEDIYTSSLNLAGLPGISVPCGKVNDLPFGIQIVGKEFQEAEILQTAWTVENM